MSARQIVVADDDAGIRTVLSHALGREGYEVRTAGSVAELVETVRADVPDAVLVDVVMPDGSGLDAIATLRSIRSDLPVVVISAQNTFVTAVDAAAKGAYEYLPKPFDIDELLALIKRAVAERTSALAPEKGGREQGAPLVGRSPAMQELYRILARIMQTDLTVLVTGESGTGKELVARALHDYGPRKNRSFVAINMAAIPRELIEAELFGHEKGAFTGAAARASGRFEQAEGGTLFLDEIGDMPMDAQTRLLRVLQEREYTTIGGKGPRRTDVRIVAATNQDLRARIDDGQFREDLYYRLNVVPVRLPALRERPQDIRELADHFLERTREAGLPTRRFSAEALDRLSRYNWPGNVRELENVVHRLVALAIDDTIDEGIVAAELARGDGAATRPTAGGAPDVETAVRAAAAELLSEGVEGDLHRRIIERVERSMLATVMTETRGNQIKAAALLGLNRNTLRKRLRELDVPVARSVRR